MTFIKPKPIVCKRCGQQVSFYDGGVVQMSPCRCKRESERVDRVKKTIDPEFFGPDRRLKLMDSWKPPLFERQTPFPELMRAQRAILISKLYEFAFRPSEEYGKAMSRSVNARLNLFLRGPQGAGRGLIAANVKIMAALGDLSVTPRDKDAAWARFEVFKEAANKATALGQTGEEARSGLYWNYENVDVMVVEGVRTDTRLDIRGDSVRHKSMGAQSIDRLMAQRANRSRGGSMVITSHDFLGQIRETLGDAFLDEMCSQRTCVALLLSPEESDVLHGHLSKTYEEHRNAVNKLRHKEAAEDRKRLTDRTASAEDGAVMRGALLFGAAMGSWSPPGPTIMDVARQLVENDELGKESVERFREFVKEEDAGGRLFDDERRTALVRAFSTCPGLQDAITEKEALEIVNIVRMAITPGRLESVEATAEEMIKEMAGV